METKKTEVIPFRTTKSIKEKLETDALMHGWKVAKMVEVIISKYYDTKNDDEETTALQVYNLITSKKINSMNELTQWAIQTNNLEKIGYSAPIWSELIKETKNVGEDNTIIQNHSFVSRSHLHFISPPAVITAAAFLFYPYKTTKIAKS